MQFPTKNLLNRQTNYWIEIEIENMGDVNSPKATTLTERKSTTQNFNLVLENKLYIHHEISSTTPQHSIIQYWAALRYIS